MENKVYSARIYTNDFNRIISATKAFVAKSGTRKAHQYIKLEFNAENQRVTAIAVDGYRMSVEHSIISDCENDFIVYIKPTVSEMEKMQTLPIGYTRVDGVSERQSKTTIGNGWTVDVIAHILKGLKEA